MGGCVGWGGWHFDNGALSKIDDVLAEDITYITPCPSSCCPPGYFFDGQELGTILKLSYFLNFLWDTFFMLKSYGVGRWVAYRILVSGPFGF